MVVGKEGLMGFNPNVRRSFSNKSFFFNESSWKHCLLYVLKTDSLPFIPIFIQSQCLYKNSFWSSSAIYIGER